MHYMQLLLIQTRGRIYIRLISGVDYNLIYFSDIATGIDPLAMLHIFKDFYTTKKTGQVIISAWVWHFVNTH